MKRGNKGVLPSCFVETGNEKSVHFRMRNARFWRKMDFRSLIRGERMTGGSSRELQIDHCRGDDQEGRVEAVEHAAVAGKDFTAVLDAQLAFEQTFH